ncbi:MAG: PAS domain S-box protein, partial [Acidobacteriota bacterium]
MDEFSVGDLGPTGSEGLLKSFFAEAAVGLSVTDLEGRFLKVNPAYCSLTGYTEAELKTRDFQSITHPDDLPRTMAKVSALLAGEVSSFLIEERYIRKDAIVVWVLNSVSVIRDKQGRATNLVRLSQDITERMGLEESLRHAEEHTESILASITDMHILFDRNWRYLYVNDAAVRTMGRPRGQIVGQTLWELYPDVSDTELGRQYRRAMDEHVSVNFEFHYEGRDVWWDNRCYAVPAGLAVFATDITERKRAEEALRKAEQKYREIFENAGEGIFQSTPDGRFITANPALARMHGFDSPEEFIRSRTDISREIYADPERRKEFKRLLEECGVVRDFEHQVFRKDRSKISISVNARAVRDQHGEVLYYEGTAQDITERKRAEEALAQSEVHFRSLIEHAADIISTYDANGVRLYTSPSVERVLRYKAEEMIGRSGFELLHPDDLPLLASLFAEAASVPGTTITRELRCRHKDG